MKARIRNKSHVKIQTSRKTNTITIGGPNKVFRNKKNFPKLERKIWIYLCGCDYQMLGLSDNVDIYKSMVNLKGWKKCWRECGIVQVKIEPENAKWDSLPQVIVEVGRKKK